MNSYLSEARRFCAMRHESGNCLPRGDFCTAVNDEICVALKHSYCMGYSAGYRNGSRIASSMAKENTDE